jgi:hypothetical protein
VFDRALHTAFPIQDADQHGRATVAACGGCHLDTSTPTDPSTIGCTSSTCHTPGAPDGLDGKHGDVGGYQASSLLCMRCHADAQVNRIAQHLPFQIQVSAPHYRSACLSCHPSNRSDKPFGADFSKTGCLGCHVQSGGTSGDPVLDETDAQHPSSFGYAYGPNCASCHPDGGKFDHVKFFPIGMTDQHGPATIPQCTTCHADSSNVASVTCVASGCHVASGGTSGDPKLDGTDSLHANVGGYQATSPLCLRCHADSQVDPVAMHLPFGIYMHATSTGTQNDTHYRKACLTCHPNPRVDKPFGEDFVFYSCIGSCHDPAEMNNRHSGRNGYVPIDLNNVSGYMSTNCTMCHASGGGG